MKIKYCPSCAGIDTKVLPTGAEQCLKCKFIGDMREGSMDEINQHKKSLNAGMQPLLPGQQKPGNSATQSQLRQKLESLRGKSTGDVEFL